MSGFYNCLSLMKYQSNAYTAYTCFSRPEIVLIKMIAVRQGEGENGGGCWRWVAGDGGWSWWRMAGGSITGMSDVFFFSYFLFYAATTFKTFSALFFLSTWKEFSEGYCFELRL